MADFANPSTLAVQASVNDAPAPWVVITRAQYDAWSAISPQYRKWVVDHIEEMTAQEKAAADAAALAAQRDGQAAQLDQIEGVTRAFMLVVLDELNNHALKINAILDAIDAAASLAALKTSVAAIADYPQRTSTQLKTAVRGKLGT